MLVEIPLFASVSLSGSLQEICLNLKELVEAQMGLPADIAFFTFVEEDRKTVECEEKYKQLQLYPTPTMVSLSHTHASMEHHVFLIFVAADSRLYLGI